MHSPSSSSHSPMSTASENSQLGAYYRDDNSMNCDLAPTTLVSHQVYDTLGNILKPSLVITENPVEKFRFRYKSEMHGTHGSLMGRNSEKSKKTYPTVEVIIIASLFSIDVKTRDMYFNIFFFMFNSFAVIMRKQ